MVKFLKYIYTNKIKNKVELVLHFKFVDKGSTWQIVINSQISHQGRLNYITLHLHLLPGVHFLNFLQVYTMCKAHTHLTRYKDTSLITDVWSVLLDGRCHAHTLLVNTLTDNIG